MVQEFLIALGANLPTFSQSPAQNCAEALREVQNRTSGLGAVSRFYQTPAFPAGSGPDYVNAAFVAKFDGTPHELLTILHDVEKKFQRLRTQRWGARTLDLDMIACGQEILPKRELVEEWMALPASEQPNHTPTQLLLPHPRLHERAFVLIPLSDVAPNWRHPLLGKSVAEMAHALAPEFRADVRPLG